MQHRVVVTGLGVVSPIGSTRDEFWNSLVQGTSGVGPVTLCEASDMATRIAAEVKDFEPLDWLDSRKELRKTDRFTQMALAASIMAYRDGSLQLDEVDSRRIGVIIGSGIGGLTSLSQQIETLLNRGPKRMSPFMIPMVIPNLAAGYVSIKLGLKGPNMCVTTACASGTHAIGEAFRLVKLGYADCMFCGGAEATINRTALGGFGAMRALSTRNEEPERASRPFDANRDGFVLGEGAGILLIESLEHAIARKSHIYAELIGFGMSGDAYHISAPSPDGEGPANCMAAAIEDAGIRSVDIGYINAHGTSTTLNDKTETLAIKRVFGEHAYSLLISSTKSMIGHLLGAAGGVEAVATVLTIERDVIPPTINLDTPDPELNLDFVPNKARSHPIELAMSNSFGFGGTNACVIFRKYTESQEP